MKNKFQKVDVKDLETVFGGRCLLIFRIWNWGC